MHADAAEPGFRCGESGRLALTERECRGEGEPIAVLDVMDSATGARREPLRVMITTAGTDRTSVCWEQHAYAERVLAGTVEDGSLFCYIATIDDGDDWREEASWIKANPNFGITVKPDYL